MLRIKWITHLHQMALLRGGGGGEGIKNCKVSKPGKKKNTENFTVSHVLNTTQIL